MKSETTDEDLSGEPAADDAIELLMADHENVRMLFADYEDLVAEGAPAEERGQLARQICSELIAHSTAEEEIFYPAAREAIELTDLVDQAETEHSSAMTLVAQIQRMDPSDEQFDELMTQLQEAIDQHMHEEEGELLPRVQESELDLESLGEQIAQRKEEVLAELEEAE